MACGAAIFQRAAVFLGFLKIRLAGIFMCASLERGGSLDHDDIKKSITGPS